MKTALKCLVLFLIGVAMGVLPLCAACSGQVVRLETEVGKATAVCIGDHDSGESARVFVTAKHNLRDSEQITLLFAGKRYAGRDLITDPKEDIAVFVADCPAKPLPLWEGDLPAGSVLEVAGFGPEYHGRFTGSKTRRATLRSVDTAIQIDEQVVPGDSGGPLVKDWRTVGIIKGFDSDKPRETVFVSASKVHECLRRVYRVQCPPGGCPIYIRPEVRQPVIGFGIPVGPPQIVGVATPAPRKYVPAPSQPSAGQTGPQGPAGPQGPPGRDGQDVDRAHVEAVINAWLEANLDRMQPDLTAIESRLGELERRSIRVILSEGGKVIDDETYGPGEPVVLDIKRLKAGSQQ